MTNTHWNTEEVLKTIKDKLAGKTFTIKVDDFIGEYMTCPLKFMLNEDDVLFVVAGFHTEEEPENRNDCTIELVLIEFWSEEYSKENEELFDEVKRILKHDLKFEVTEDMDKYY